MHFSELSTVIRALLWGRNEPVAFGSLNVKVSGSRFGISEPVWNCTELTIGAPTIGIVYKPVLTLARLIDKGTATVAVSQLRLLCMLLIWKICFYNILTMILYQWEYICIIWMLIDVMVSVLNVLSLSDFVLVVFYWYASRKNENTK